MVTDWFGVATTPLSGGYSGETFLVGTGGDAVVLRIYRRRPERAAIDASLLRLVRGIVPVPAVVDLRRPTAGSPGVLVTERLPGVALDRILREEPPGLDWRRLGTALGRVLGSLSGIPFLRPGLFTDATLAVESADMVGDLHDWADRHRDSSRIATWAEDDWRALEALVDDAQRLLDDRSAGTPPCTVLVHSDFNPKNILVDPVTCDVTGLVDWEFSHAGSPYTDIGNLTRFDRDERLLGPLVEALVDSAPAGLDEPVRQGRAMDLWALIDLAGRTVANPVTALATELLLAQARSGDLAAWPWQTARVDPAAEHPVS